MRLPFIRTLFVVTALDSSAVAALPAPHAFAGGPHITAQEASAPYVTGMGFTPFGPVVLVERQVGLTKPIAKLHINADANGNIAQFGECDGNNALTFRALDVTSTVHTNKTPANVYPCIG